jgi:hypothetical protein
MAEPTPPYGALPEAVLRAAGGIGDLGSALDAELLVSTLLGSVYEALPPDRGEALEAFVGALREHLSAGTAAAAPLLAALLDGVPGSGPAWAPALGTVRPVSAYAFGDRYGDQTSYVATFGYEDPALGGPEHAVVVLADHNLGLARDVLVLAPAGPAIAQFRESLLADPDGMTWLSEVPLATVRRAADAYLRSTDLAADLPPGESLPANRWLAGARLDLLPAATGPTAATGAEAGGAARTGPPAATATATAAAGAAAAGDPGAAVPGGQPGLAGQFLASPEATLAGLAATGGARGESVGYCLGLIVDFATTRGGDPLRWSPRAVTTFLTEWVHQRAVLDTMDVATLPGTLGAWIVWAGHRLDLPDHAIASTFQQVTTERDEFTRLCATGERRSPAAEAMARLVAEGVDLTNEAAVDTWLRAYNAEHEG